MIDPSLNCPHCGEPCVCRATRDDLNAALVIIEELLMGGQHEGFCTNDENPYDSCDVHTVTSQARHGKAKEFLENMKRGKP